MVEDPALDKIGLNKEKKVKSQRALNTLKTKVGLIDPFRVKHKNDYSDYARLH
jgi:hypothetical protein